MSRLRFSVLFACFSALTASAQAPWYEPGSWGDLVMQMNESKMLKTKGLDFSNHYFKKDEASKYSILQQLLCGVKNPQSLIDSIGCLFYLPTANMAYVRTFNNEWLKKDNVEFHQSGNCQYSLSKRPILKTFYKYPALFYTYHEDNSWLSVNPILNLQAGPKSQWGSNYSQNTRGLEIRGTLNGKVGFYSRILENQWFAPQFVRSMPDSLGALPGAGWWRNFGANKNGYDFFSAKAYINFNVVKNHVNAAFGHDNFFIGNGYRSLILSNFAKEYLFLKLNSNLGPFHYQNIYAQLNNLPPKPGPLPGNTLLPKKYMAVHRLSYNNNRFEIGATEMIVFDRDSAGTKGFELEYLNPIIFYRAVESNLGSRDNALIALDAKAYLPANIIFYGQFLIDEFSINKVKSNTGWWANKFGWQAGLKSTQTIGTGLLFLQAEMNSVKPYTYSHYRVSQNWTQYGQPLAHPLGANFKEIVFRALYQPGNLPRLRVLLTAMHAMKGNDSSLYNGNNYGSVLSKSNDTRVSDYGVKMLQGAKSTIDNYLLQISYMVKHNLYIDLGVQYRKQTGWQASSGTWINFGVRLNVDPLGMVF